MQGNPLPSPCVTFVLENSLETFLNNENSAHEKSPSPPNKKSSQRISVYFPIIDNLCGQSGQIA